MHREQKEENILIKNILLECKKVFWILLLFSAASNVLGLFLPLYTSQVLDRVISSGSLSTLLMLTVITIGAFVASNTIEGIKGVALNRLGNWFEKKILPPLTMQSIKIRSLYRINNASSMMTDLAKVRSFLTGPAMRAIFDFPWATIYLIAIFMIHPYFGLITIVGIIFLCGAAYINEIMTDSRYRKLNETTSTSLNALMQTTSNAEVMEAMGMTERVTNAWLHENEKNMNAREIIQGRENLIVSITRLFRSSLQIGIMALGSILAIDGKMTTGSVIASSILISKALFPFENVIATWKMLINAKISYKKLTALLNTASNKQDNMKLPTPEGRVSIENVYFAPPNSKVPTIRGISFEVNAGTITAIVGASGSGKSTLSKMITGIWKPLSGTVRLDGADVYTWDREDFGKHIGYVPQEVELFEATVKGNISRMENNPDSEKVVEAAKIAGIHEMILKMPKGYDTIICGDSSTLILSGGQKQLLGLARAFYGHVKLLVLDEPNSNLDANGDILLTKALKIAKANNITVFLITHRTHILSMADNIAVLQDGMLLKFGSKDDVLKGQLPLDNNRTTAETTKPPENNPS